jgi:hypothetical protein
MGVHGGLTEQLAVCLFFGLLSHHYKIVSYFLYCCFNMCIDERYFSICDRIISNVGDGVDLSNQKDEEWLDIVQKF